MYPLIIIKRIIFIGEALSHLIDLSSRLCFNSFIALIWESVQILLKLNLFHIRVKLLNFIEFNKVINSLLA